jgi:hypothetical protein
MASDLKYSVPLKNAQQDAITTVLGSNAVLELYSGTKPAGGPSTAITSQVLLSTHACSATFAPGSANGVVTLNSIANGTGTAGAGAGTNATWYRLKTSGGVAHVDGTVGISGCDLNIDNPNIATNQVVKVTSFTLANGN